MAGFANDANLSEIMFSDNMDFTGAVPPVANFTTNGQLPIGSTVAPHIRVNTLSAGAGVSIVNGNGTITIGIAGGGAPVLTLTGNSGGAIGPTAGNINTIGTGSITISGSGSTLTTQLTGLTNHSVLVGAGTATITSIANGTTGQVLTANTGADPGWTTLPPAFTWSVITANQTAAVNNGYICNKAGTLALALPATSAVGDIIRVTGINTALGWQITQASGQQIFFGATSTTLGATGTLTSSATRDAIQIVCITANTTWQVLSSIGNITVV